VTFGPAVSVGALGTLAAMSNAAELTVGTLSGTEVITIPPDATLRELAETLITEGVGAAIVGTTARVQGIVSERDIVAAVAAGKDPATTTVSAIATTELAWADAGSSVADVAAEMFDRWVRHIPLEHNGKLVGIVSARDLLGSYLSTESPD
jgi:CBS domain-containing protein